MQTTNHISKNEFFSILEKRLYQYEEAIIGTRAGSGMRLQMRTCSVHNIEKIKRLDSENRLFGNGFWGYGINNICDGMEANQNPDVETIKRIPGLNKHHETYRNLLLISFKIENSYFFVSTFSIDSCSPYVNYNLNVKYELKDFNNAIIKGRLDATIIELSFRNIEKPIRFQLETYSFGGRSLSGGQLANYYIDTIKELASNFMQEDVVNKLSAIPDFLKDFISGIRELQFLDINAECIRKLKIDKKKDESLFRNFFLTWFKAKEYAAVPELEKGNGRIDLKVTHSLLNDKIIEFKGWWNPDKNEIVQQLYKYLTDFEEDGYIFMINNTSNDISEKYKQMIVKAEMNYIPGSWEEITFKPTSFIYYKSKHSFIRTKIVYHFIFLVY